MATDVQLEDLDPRELASLPLMVRQGLQNEFDKCGRCGHYRGRHDLGARRVCLVGGKGDRCGCPEFEEQGANLHPWTIEARRWMARALKALKAQEAQADGT